MTSRDLMLDIGNLVRNSPSDKDDFNVDEQEAGDVKALSEILNALQKGESRVVISNVSNTVYAFLANNRSLCKQIEILHHCHNCYEDVPILKPTKLFQEYVARGCGWCDDHNDYRCECGCGPSFRKRDDF